MSSVAMPVRALARSAVLFCALMGTRALAQNPSVPQVPIAPIVAGPVAPSDVVPPANVPLPPRSTVPAARPAPGQGFPGLGLFEDIRPAGGTQTPDPKAPPAPVAPDPKTPVPVTDPAPQPAPDPFLKPDRKLNVTWDDGGFRYRNADGSFNLHLGGRLMTDDTWWSQSANLRRAATLPANSPQTLVTGVGPGIGDLQDGAFIRRARVVADGTIYKNIDFKVEFDFENYNSIAFDESYVGARNLPFVGMVRVGQMHVPFGLEAYTSSRFLPQMERSPLFDAFYQEFAPGIFTNTTFLDERVTMQHMVHKIDNFQQFNGASFGDGKWAYSGRVSALPWYEEDGRYLLHLGFAYQWRKGSTPQDFNGGTTLTTLPNPSVTTDTDLVRFRARPSIRDSIGLQGDGTRVVDTGNIIADHVNSVNGEFLWYQGPFWVQSEIEYSQVNNAVYPASNRATQRGDLNFWGTYVQTGFFLTGESRGYDKPMGKYGRVVPKTNFFLVRDDCGNVSCGPGAWELTYRFAYLDLNDKTVLGGLYSEHTVGVNWYWNSNIKFQFNYINGFRAVSVPTGNGSVHGFGLRGALEF
jgi:phosphate-selective porin OprO/OprP